MKNKKFTRTLIIALSCLLLVGVAFGIVSAAEGTDSAATTAEIVYKNVSYKGAPGLVFYVGTDAELAENQKIKVYFWNEENKSGIYNEHNASYVREASATVEIDGETYSAVLADGTAPSELRRSIYAKAALVETDNNGNETVAYLGELLEYSVFEYALEMFSAKGGAADDQDQIYTALLDYAASIQQVLFTNPYNGVVKEKELAAAGGWADAYYVVELNRYIYNEESGEFEPDGEKIRYYYRNATDKVELNESLYYTKDGVTYSFRGYRNTDNSYILADNDLVKALNAKIAITKQSQSSTYHTMNIEKIGVNAYNVLYGVYNGDYITYDGGQSLSELGNNYTNFWAQYNVSPGTAANAVTTVEITDYYYKGQIVKNFYTKDGSISGNINDYHYVAVNKSTDVVGTGNLSATRSDYKFIDVSDASITKEKHNIVKSGYSDYVADPAADDGDSTRGNVLAVIKHIYDKDSGKTTPYENVVDVNNIKAETASSSSFAKVGYLTWLGSVSPAADGKTGSNKIGGITATISNKTAEIVYDEDYYPVHTFETDLYFDSLTSGTGTQITMKSGSTTMIQFNVASPSRESDEFYISVESGPGKGVNNFNATGVAIGGNILAGYNGTRTVGSKLYQRTWYNVRVEYIAAGSSAVIKLYINGELYSYINDAASCETDETFSSVSIFNLNAARQTYIYFDNTYLATDGKIPVQNAGGEDGPAADIEYSDKFYTNGNSNHGIGKYFESSLDVDKSYKPANGYKTGVTMITETNKDGTTNTALEMYKSKNAGYSASVAAQDPAGNIYVFETDLKIVGSDNKTEWAMKFALQNKNIASPADTQEIAMICIMVKDGYWTLSQLNTPYDSSIKFRLDEWHNFRFLYDPITSRMQVWVNNIEVLNRTGYSRTTTDGVYNDNSTFAGVNLNLRARPDNSVYTVMLFDNLYCSTEYQDSLGAGENFDASDKYDNFESPNENTAHLTGQTATGATNKYVETTDLTLTGAPNHNRGHEYIFETDIKWLGATGFENIDETTAKILELNIDSAAGNILTISGVATNREGSDLLIKAGTVTAGTILNGYWMNFRVVYAPSEPQMIDDVLNYVATYTVYVNGGLVYTGTVASPDVDNLTFEKATLTISGAESGVTPLVDIDNTFIGSRYIDNHGQGDNYASSEHYMEGKVDGDLIIEEPKTLPTDISIGTDYLFEADVRWLEGAATIQLVGADGAFFTIYMIPDDSDPGYAKLSLENDITKAFASVYNNIWYNIRIVVNKGVYTVYVSNVEKATLTAAHGASYTGAKISASVVGGLAIDNTYVDIENKNFSANGDNKDKIYTSYIDMDDKGLLEYDKVLADADPNADYTDAYVSINKAQIIIGKNTGMSSNVLTILNGKANGTATHIFETDLKWGESKWGVEAPIAGTNQATFFTMKLLGADGVELVTIYAVGVYNIDTVSPDDQFIKFFASLDDVKEGNSFASLRADLFCNIRIEYSADGSYDICFNNETVYSGNGVASDAATGLEFALGEDVYDTSVYIKNTYFASMD